jgi:hypothetical protein
MVQHALLEAGGRDHTLLGIPDQELLEPTKGKGEVRRGKGEVRIPIECF